MPVPSSGSHFEETSERKRERRGKRTIHINIRTCNRTWRAGVFLFPNADDNDNDSSTDESMAFWVVQIPTHKKKRRGEEGRGESNQFHASGPN